MDLNYESVLWLTPNKVGIRVKDGKWIDKSKENPILSFTLPKSYPKAFKVISTKSLEIKSLEMGYIYFDTIIKKLYMYDGGLKCFINISRAYRIGKDTTLYI